MISHRYVSHPFKSLHMFQIFSCCTCSRPMLNPQSCLISRASAASQLSPKFTAPPGLRGRAWSPTGKLYQECPWGHQHQPMFKTLKWLKSVTCDIFCGFVFFGKSIEVSQNDKMFEKTKDVSETEAWPKCPEPCVPSCCALAAAPCSKCQNQQRLIGKQAEKESFQKKSEEMQKKQKMQTMRCESLKDEPWDTKTSLDDKGKSQNTALDNSVQVPHHWKLNLVSSQRSIWLQQLWNRCFVHSTCILKSKFRTAARPCSSKMNAPTPTPEPGIVQWTWTFSLRTFANLQCYITLYYTYSLIVSVF